MIKECLETLRGSKESNIVIAKNNDLTPILIRRFREGKEEPSKEIARILNEYFDKGGASYIRMQNQPEKELKKQNNAIVFYLNKMNIPKIDRDKAINDAYKCLLKDKGISLKEVGI